MNTIRARGTDRSPRNTLKFGVIFVNGFVFDQASSLQSFKNPSVMVLNGTSFTLGHCLAHREDWRNS